MELVTRTVITILVLLAMARINGPKQISQMSFYDYAAGISVGSVAASVSTDKSLPLVNGLLVIVLFLSASFLIGWLTNKSMTARLLFTGKPIVLVEGGQICWKGLKKARINMNELMSSLRYGGYFELKEVEDAILETNGKMSVRPKSSARPPKTKELKLSPPDPARISEVVIDGELLRGNLEKAGKNEEWLEKMIKSKGVKNNKEVALATLDSNGSLSIYMKN